MPRSTENLKIPFQQNTQIAVEIPPTRLKTEVRQNISSDHNQTPSSERYSYISPEDLLKIQRIRKEHNLALGLPADYVPPVAPNYDIVFERFNWEKAVESGDAQAIEICRANMKKNLETAINEWLGRSQIETKYHIENNRLVADGDDTPLGEKIKRGVAVRKLSGSNDLEREKAESVAFLYTIESTLTDPNTPTETIIVSLSPPSSKENSPYQSSYVDVWRKNDQGEIVCTRNSTNLSNLDHFNLAKKLDPQFELNSDFPFDANCLASPIIIHGETPSLELTGLSPRYCDKVQISLGILTDALIEDLQESDINWLKSARRINTVRYQVQEISDKLADASNWQNYSIESLKSTLSPNEQMKIFGAIPLRQVISGCGSAPSYNLDNPLTSSLKANSTENSVSKFGETWEYHTGKCRDCGVDPARVGPCNICDSCEKKY